MMGGLEKIPVVYLVTDPELHAQMVSLRHSVKTGGPRIHIPENVSFDHDVLISLHGQHISIQRHCVICHQ